MMAPIRASNNFFPRGTKTHSYNCVQSKLGEGQKRSSPESRLVFGLKFGEGQNQKRSTPGFA